MKQRYLKKPCSFLLVSAMVLTMFPTFSTSVHAEENQSPTKEQFSTVEELKNYDTNDNDGVKNPAKVYFGNNNQQWWIAGSQSNDSITLFSASSMRDDVQFESNYMDNKTYDDKWNCTYPDREPAEVFPNHYGASYIRNVTLKEMEASFFTSSEQALINETTIYTDDTKNNSVYSTTDKLYLAYGDQEDYNHITVGKNSANDLNDGLRIDPSYWGKSVLELFWIRSPFVSNDDPNDGSSVLTAWPSKNYPAFNGAQTSNVEKIRPAFELNSSTILFASAVPSATTTGNLTLQDTDGDGAFTLRYDAGKYSKNLGSAVTSYDESKVILTDVPNGTYLVAQNSNGAYAKQITNETLTVTAANAQIATTELQFTVNEHDYVAVVTPPNCTEKGYTTYTCRNCSHSYKGNEVDATGHTWGEWKVIKEATTTETGKKERVCERCDYKEIAVISMISNKEQPTTSTKPDTAVKTGDSTNILLWSMVMVISLAGMLTALFFKRRRNR